MIHQLSKKHTLINKGIQISDTIKDVPYKYYFRPSTYPVSYQKSIILYKRLCYSICFYSFGYMDGFNIIKDSSSLCNITSYIFKYEIKRYSFKFGIRL